MLGALVDAGVPLEALNEAVGSLGLPGCRLVAREVRKNGFRAVQVTVEYEPEHAHRHLSDILGLIEAGALSPKQKRLAAKIFRRMAEAEAKAHGCDVEKVHFHEVGAADSIADIVGAAVGWDLLGVERVAASPVPTGGGKVRIAHGLVSVPAPATAELLRGVPLAASSVEMELTTPTGAAILTTLCDDFGPLPPMTVERIGCGAGQREVAEQPNILRLFLGHVDESLFADDESAQDTQSGDQAECCWMLETNLDDMSGELVAYCAERLREAGALDVYTTAVAMKKNRPGVVLSVLCRESDLESLEAIVFAETTTLGVRRWPVSRSVLERQAHEVETAWGRIQGKIAWLDAVSTDGAAERRPRFSPEFESCRQAADRHRVPLQTVYEAARAAFDPKKIGE